MLVGANLWKDVCQRFLYWKDNRDKIYWISLIQFHVLRFNVTRSCRELEASIIFVEVVHGDLGFCLSL